MAGVAKVNSKLPAMPEKYEMPTTLHVNVQKHPQMAKADVGKAVRFMGHGVVQSIHKDATEHRMEIAVKKLRAAGNAASASESNTDDDDGV